MITGASRRVTTPLPLLRVWAVPVTATPPECEPAAKHDGAGQRDRAEAQAGVREGRAVGGLGTGAGRVSRAGSRLRGLLVGARVRVVLSSGVVAAVPAAAAALALEGVYVLVVPGALGERDRRRGEDRQRQGDRDEQGEESGGHPHPGIPS